MVDAGFAKCYIFFTAILILAQGVVYLGLAIWGVTLQDCNQQTTDVTAQPFEFAVDLVYFKREACGDPTIKVPQLSTSTESQLDVDWGTSSIITVRMYIFLLSYIVVSAIWVVTSLLVIVTVCCPMTKLTMGLCFWPWFVIVLLGSVLDAVATGYYIHDIIHTTSAEETFEYVGVSSNDTNVINFLKTFDAYFITPAIVMACVSSRVVLIWLLNICGVSFSLSLAYGMFKEERSNKSPIVASQHSEPAPQQPRIMVEELQSQPQLQQQELQQPMPYQMQEQYPSQIQPKPLPIQMAPMAQRQSSIQMAQQKSLQSPPPSAPSHDSGLYSETGRLTSMSGDGVTYRNGDAHPDKLDYPPQSPSQSQEQHATSSQVLAISPLNSRYSTGDNLFQSTNPNQPQRVSDELRSQLPWSYTSIQTKPQVPRKPTLKMYPEIPEPDYATDAGHSSANGVDGMPTLHQQQQQTAVSRW